MRNVPTTIAVVVCLTFAGPSPLRSDDGAAKEDDGFVALFAEPGAPKGWTVQAWDDVANAAPDGAAWRVDDAGVLHGSEPRGTWLVSEQEHGDFELAFEFKLPPQGNSGCGLRFPAKGDPAFDGLELQMCDPRYHGDNVVGADELTGALYQAITPRATPFKPEDWNAYHIKCRGPHVHVTLNGEVVVDVNLDEIGRPLKRGEPLNARPRRGHIGFQELSRGGGHVQIRNAKLKVLDGAAERAAAGVVIDITAAPDGGAVIKVDGKNVAQAELRETLRARREAAAPQPAPSFVLRADDSAPYGVIERVLIDLAMSKYVDGRIETRAADGHAFEMPRKEEIAAGPAPVELQVTAADGETTVHVGGDSIKDLGDGLVQLLTGMRKGLAPDTTAVVWPEAAVPYADVVRAYAACQSAGFEKVAFRTSTR